MNLDPQTRIYLLSSDRENIVAVIKCLKKLGFSNIKHFENGIEAMQSLISNRVDYVICDQNLKFISGWLFIKEIKINEKVPNIPVTLFGKEAPPESEEVLKQFGVIKYVQFPVSISSMEFSINSTLSLFNTNGTIENKYTQAKTALLEQKSEKAAEMYEELRGLTSKSVRSSLGLAHAYVQTNETDKADTLIKEVAKSGDTTPQSLLLAAKVCLQDKRNDEAGKNIKKLLESHDDIFYYSRSVKLFIEFKQYQTSEDLCNTAIERNFQVPDFHICLAKCRYTQEDFESCLELLFEAEKIYGQSNDLLNLKGVCLKRIGAYSDAIESYENALKLDPTNPKVYFNMAICYIEMSDFPNSIKYLETCLKISPSFARAREKLKELKEKAS
ncbi:MAG: tetratricopeptide repeat protein [Oligoflexales bacterium]